MQDASYARPTVIGPTKLPRPERRNPVHISTDHFPISHNYSTFKTLPPADQDALFILDRAEAARREQYEAQYEALIRERESRGFRKPLSRGNDHYRDYYNGDDEDDEEELELCSRSRHTPHLFEPYPASDLSLSRSRSTDHIPAEYGGTHQRMQRGNPYHSMSDQSLFSQAFQPVEPVYPMRPKKRVSRRVKTEGSPPHSDRPRISTQTSGESAHIGDPHYTPSTSPFLGFRSLALQSAEQSRAPSPAFLRSLPPSPIEDGNVPGFHRSTSDPLTDIRGHSANTSFTRSTLPGLGSLPSVDYSSTVVPTPQLSRGTSSAGSSPSIPCSNGSAPDSRPGSPSYWSHGPGGHHHHHIAHSLRVAFGMTPIKTQASSPPRNTSWPMSLSQTNNISGASTPFSMPASRSGSPPITLAPLKNRRPLSYHHPARGGNISSDDNDTDQPSRSTQPLRETLPSLREIAGSSFPGAR